MDKEAGEEQPVIMIAKQFSLSRGSSEESPLVDGLLGRDGYHKSDRLVGGGNGGGICGWVI